MKNTDDKLEQPDDENAGSPDVTSEYVPVYNGSELAELLMAAKGKDRSMAKFAEVCGAKPILFSRIMTKSIKKPLDPELIGKIAENVCGENKDHVTLDRLMRANGYVKNMDNESVRAAQEREIAQIREKNKDFYRSFERILTDELWNRGCMIGQITGRSPFETEEPFHDRRFRIKPSGVVGLMLRSGDENVYWYFRPEVLDEREKSFGDERRGEVYRSLAGRILRENAELHLRDLWKPNTLKNCRYSVIFTDKEYFVIYKKLIDGQKVNNYFSLILMDMEQKKVTDEYIMPRFDGAQCESLFTK